MNKFQWMFHHRLLEHFKFTPNISINHQKTKKKKMCEGRWKLGLGEVISVKKWKARLVIVTCNYIWSTHFGPTVIIFELVSKSIHEIRLKLHLMKVINEWVKVNVLVFRRTMLSCPKCGSTRSFLPFLTFF